MAVAAAVGAVVVSQRHLAFNEPFFLQWHLTDRCNLACQHCYRDAPKADLDWEALRAILADYIDFLERLGRPGRIQFSGGEPFLSPHLYALIRQAKSQRIPSRVLSNGTLVTLEVAQRLRRAGCRLVQISLEGLEKTHDAIRGAGSFQQALAGARALRQAGVEVTISMTLSQINLAEALDVARLAEEIADRVSFHRLVPVGSGETLASQLLSPAQVRALMADLFAFRQKTSIDLPLRDPLWRAFFNPHVRGCNGIAGCAIGYNGLTVESNGDVYPCRRLQIVVGNLLRQRFHEIWEAPLLQALRDRDRLSGQCGRCRLRWICGGCRGIAYAVSGDPLAEDPQCFRRPSFGEKVRRGLASMRDIIPG